MTVPIPPPSRKRTKPMTAPIAPIRYRHLVAGMNTGRALALLLVAALAITGCKRENREAKAIAMEQRAHPWQGEIVELLPPNTPNWIYVDVSALRDDARIRAIMGNLVGANPDAMTIALMEAEEVVFGWSGVTNEAPLSLLRSDHISSELRAGIERGQLPGSDDVLEDEKISVHRMSVSPKTQQAIAAPAPNLIFSGPRPQIEAVIHRYDQAPATRSTSASATMVFAGKPPANLIDAAIARFENAMVTTQLRAIEQVSGAVQLGDGIETTVRLHMPRHGTPEMAATLVRMFIAKTLPGMLTSAFSPEYAQHLSERFDVSAEADGPRRGVLVRGKLDANELSLWLAVLNEFASE